MVDTKDWTWVLEERCPDCGFDAGGLARDEIGPTTRRVAVRFEGYLGRDGVRDRPAADVWSVLEYGCHLRDVGRIFGERLDLMLDEDGPQFANWDQDETAAVEMAASLGALADGYDAVRADQWDRQGFRSNGSIFTVESLGRYMVHDLVHHVWDIEPDAQV